MAVWWNWQTRESQKLLLKSVGVQVPLPLPRKEVFMRVWIVVIEKHPNMLVIPFCDRFKVFADDKKDEAIQWAKDHGYESMFIGVSDEVGQYCFYGCGEYRIGIMHADVN